MRRLQRNAERKIDRLVAHHRVAAHLDRNASKNTTGYNGSSGGGCHSGADRISDGADQVGRILRAVDLCQVAQDLTRAQAARIERDDLVIEAGQAALVFARFGPFSNVGLIIGLPAEVTLTG